MTECSKEEQLVTKFGVEESQPGRILKDKGQVDMEDGADERQE